MPANPPTEITIGGKIIAIRIDPKLEAWGEYRADDAEIVLATRTITKQSSLRETLRHEMLHAALDICGLTHIEGFDRYEECFVRALENVFFPAWGKVHQQLTTLE
jgi:hypothetical protein